MNDNATNGAGAALGCEIGLRLNRALMERDVETAMELLARYLTENGLKLPAGTLAELARRGLIGTR